MGHSAVIGISESHGSNQLKPTSDSLVCFAAIAAARCRIATYRLPLHNSHPSIDAGDCPTTCFRGTADSDHQVLADGCCMSAVTSCEQELATQSGISRLMSFDVKSVLEEALATLLPGEEWLYFDAVVFVKNVCSEIFE